MVILKPRRLLRSALLLAAVASLAACGGRGGRDSGPLVPGEIRENTQHPDYVAPGDTIWNVFRSRTADQTVNVNRYIWAASLDVLNFLPVQSVDPFTGLIVMGYGTPPGGGRAYRATVHIKDPALEARSLRVALQSRGGTVAPGTVRAVEDAILARARQMRIEDSRF